MPIAMAQAYAHTAMAVKNITERIAFNANPRENAALATEAAEILSISRSPTTIPEAAQAAIPEATQAAPAAVYALPAAEPATVKDATAAISAQPAAAEADSPTTHGDRAARAG